MRSAYVRVRSPEAERGGAEKIYRADGTKISSKLLTNPQRERERERRKKRRISNSTPEAEFLNERGANNARVFLSAPTIKRERTRRKPGYENLGIWNMVGLRIQKARGNYYRERADKSSWPRKWRWWQRKTRENESGKMAVGREWPGTFK